MIFVAVGNFADDLIVGPATADAVAVVEPAVGAGHIAAAAPGRRFFGDTVRRRHLCSGLRGEVSAQWFDVGT